MKKKDQWKVFLLQNSNGITFRKVGVGVIKMNKIYYHTIGFFERKLLEPTIKLMIIGMVILLFKGMM